MFLSDCITIATQLLVLVIITIVLGWYLYYQYCFTYWKRKGVPTIPPRFPAGNLGRSVMGSENWLVRLQKLYDQFEEAGHKHAGIYFFNGPIYYPIDLDIIKRILVTDFDHFADRGFFYDEDNYPFSANLAGLPRHKWRIARPKVTPMFTSSKLKSMFEPIFMKNTQNLVRVLEPIAQNSGEISALKYMSWYTVDIISSSALGLDSNILSNPDQNITRIIANMVRRPLWSKIKTILTEGLADPGRLIKNIYDNPEVVEWFKTIVQQNLHYRKQANVVRNDLFTSMMEIDGMTLNEMIGHTALFFAAGYETSATTMSNCLHQLAYNPNIQERLRQEIHKHLGSDYRKFTYKGVTSLVYLDYVIKETLRLFPIIALLNRRCLEKYAVPGTDVVLDPGTLVMVSVLGLHRNAQYFPDPLRFNPDRFDGQFRPFTYLPFGEGPRNCIGMRQGLLQTKLGIAATISKFRILPSPKSPKVLEFEKMPGSPGLFQESGLYVKLELV